MLRREEGIWLDHAHLAEVGGVDWIGSVEVDCLVMISFDLHSEREVLGCCYYLRHEWSSRAEMDVKFFPAEEQKIEFA
jgi:hypothetical protein